MREDLIIKREREVIGFLTYKERLDLRYKKVIDELRRQVLWWQQNAWKATFLSIYYKIKRSVIKK